MDDWGDRDMSDDHILLQSLLVAYDIPVKQLAMWTGYAATTVYKYRDGAKTIPSIIWRVLYRHTHDHRIVELMTGDVPVIVTPLPAGNGDTAATLSTLIEARGHELEWERVILDILSDGKVDALDRRQVAQIKDRFPMMLSTLVQLQQTITRQYDLSTRTRKEKPWSRKPTTTRRRTRKT